MAEEFAPGWYVGQDGTKSYWDGQQWLAPIPDSQSIAPGLPVVSAATSSPVPAVKSRKPVIIGASVVASIVLAGGVFALLTLSGSAEDSKVAGDCTADVQSKLTVPISAEFFDVKVTSVSDRFEYIIALDHMTDEEWPMFGDGKSAQDIVEIVLAEEISDANRARADSWGLAGGEGLQLVTGKLNHENRIGGSLQSDFTCINYGNHIAATSIADSGAWTDDLAEVRDGLSVALAAQG